MRALLIDPFSHTVRGVDLEVPYFLDSVRYAIGAQQVDSVLCGIKTVLWFDNFWLLKAGQKFWRLPGVPTRIGGKAIITSVSETGFPADIPPSIPVEDIEPQIDWCEDAKLLGIDELIVPARTEYGLWPRIVRQPRWRETPLQ